MAVLAVIDTHALIWFCAGRLNRLGRDARRVLERVEEGNGAIFVPALALVELAEAAHDGDVDPPGGFAVWVERLFSSGRFFPVDLTRAIVQRAEELYAIPERGDRLIAATALELGYPLITRDHEITAAAQVDTIW